MVNLTFSKIRAWIASKLFGNLITVDNKKLLTSTATNTKSEVGTMSPSTKPDTYKPVLSVDTATPTNFGESSSSTPPLSGRRIDGNAGLNSPRSSNFSTDQECKVHSVKLISPAQHRENQPQYSDDHSAVLEFTEAYLQEAFDVKSTNDLLVDQNDKVETFDVKPMDDLLADQNDEFEANQPSSSSASPTETRKWWKRNKSEPKTPTSGQFYENTSTAALITAINLSNPNQELLPIESTMNSPTQNLILPKVIPNTGITETVDNDGGNSASPSIGPLMQIPRKKVGSGSSKLPQAIDNPLATAESSLAGKDSSSKGKGKDIVEPEEKNSQLKIIEESFDVGQDRASKDNGKKKKTKRSKGKSAQVETTADSSQLVENSATDGKEKLAESNESSENKAKLERENFIASKVSFRTMFFHTHLLLTYDLKRSTKSVKRQVHRLCGTLKATLPVRTLNIPVFGIQRICGVVEDILELVPNAKHPAVF